METPEKLLNWVQGTGSKGGLMVVVDFPTYIEMRTKVPLVGMPKQVLEQTIRGLGWKGNIWWTCAVKSLQVLGKNPNVKTWGPFLESLQEEIMDVKPSKILACGPVASTMLLVSPEHPVHPKIKNSAIMKTRGLSWKISLGKDVSAYVVSALNPYTIMKESDFYRDLVFDVNKLLTNSAPLRQEKLDVCIPESPDELYVAFDKLRESTHVSCDLETTGLNPITTVIESIGFGCITPGEEPFNLIIPREMVHSTESIRQSIREFMETFPGTFVFHNGKFDLKFLKMYMGKDLSVRFTDTMLMHYAQDERPMGRFSGHGLKDLARVRFDAPNYAISFDEFYSRPEEERDYQKLYFYQAYDTYYTIRLFYELYRELMEEDPDLISVVEDILIPATEVFTDIELYGVVLAEDYLRGEVEKIVLSTSARVGHIRELLGKPDFNPVSPKQVSDLLFVEWGLHTTSKMGGHQSHAKKAILVEEDKSGNPTTGRDALLQYAKMVGGDRGTLIREIADVRLDIKICGTYLKGLLNVVDPDGRIRTDIRLIGTSTGRLASAEPNLQNIPNLYGPMVRQAFISPPGKLLYQADFSQLELRVVAHLCGDPQMIQTFKDGVDIHRVVGAKIFNKPPQEVTYLERYLSKRVDFGLLYGRSARALVEGGEMDLFVEQGGERFTEKQAQSFIDDFLNGFPQLKSWIEQQHREVLKQQFSKTIFGRRRRFPIVLREMVGSIQRQSVNTPIQSAASDICLQALIRIHRRLPSDCHILFSVHDSILIEIPENRLAEVHALCMEEMTQNIPFKSDVPFPADAEYGTSWGDFHHYEPEKVATK